MDDVFGRGSTEAPDDLGTIRAQFPAVEFTAEILSARLAVASNGANYIIEFELPVFAVQKIAEMPEALTLHWAPNGSDERLLGVGASLYSSALKPDPDGNVRHRAKYRLAQNQITTGIAVIAAAIANDATEGVLRIRSDQAMFDLTARG